jgi:hypothetical protein
MLVIGVSFAAFEAFAIKTNVWNNASGDGSWSNTANWSLGELPGTTDYASFCPSVAWDTLVIDVVGGVTIGAFIATNNALRVTGEKLTIRGGARGKIASWGNTGYCDTDDTWGWYSSVPVVVDVTVEFRPKYCTTIQIVDGTTFRCVHFMKPVIWDGDNNNAYRFVALVPSRNSYGDIYFHSTFTADGEINLQGNGNGTVYCYGKVTATALKRVEWNTGYIMLFGPDNEIGNLFLAYSGMIIPAVENAVPETAYLAMPGGSAYASGDAENEGDRFNMNNYNQTLNCLTRNNSKIDVTYKGNIWSRDADVAVYGENVYCAPTMLTLKGTTNGVSVCSIWDRVSVTWDPSDDFIEALTNCTSHTSGDIIVKRGTFHVGGNATFKTLHAIDVAAGAKFELATSAADSFSGLDRVMVGTSGRFVISPVAVTPFSGGYSVFELTAGAKIETAVAVTIGAVEYDGEFVADGTYTSDGANGTTAAAWVDGAGSVNVASSNIAIWKAAASGIWSDSANWVDGRVPTSSMKKALIDRAGGNYTVTINADAMLPKRVEIRNAGEGVAELMVATNATRADGFLSIENGAKVSVPEGGSLKYDFTGTSYVPTDHTPIRIVGGELSVTGGEAVFTNMTGGVAVGGFGSHTGKVTVTAGSIFYHAVTPVHAFVLGTGSEMALSGTGVFKCGSPDGLTNFKTTPTFSNEGGTLTVSGNADFNTSLEYYDWMTWRARGKPVVFSDNATLTQKLGDYARFGVANHGTNRAEVIFKDNARTVNSVGTGKVIGKLRIESSATFAKIGYAHTINGGWNNPAEEWVSAGSVGSSFRALRIGSTDISASNEIQPTGCRGILYVCGGEFTAEGSGGTGWEDKAPAGVLIGYGAASAIKKGIVYDGRLEVTSGRFNTIEGGFHVGAGVGKGELVVAGGLCSNGCAKASTIGLCGGVGRVVVSNGVFKSTRKNSNTDLYIGGAPITIFDQTEANLLAAGYPTERHDADGELTIVGGTTTVNGSVYLGYDGDGTITMEGTEGLLSVKNLVLSNFVAGVDTPTERKTSSTLRFKADANGVSPIMVTSKLTVSPDTKIVVEASAYAGSADKLKLLEWDTLDGDFDGVDFQATDFASNATLKVVDKALYVKRDRGFIMLLK